MKTFIVGTIPARMIGTAFIAGMLLGSPLYAVSGIGVSGVLDGSLGNKALMKLYKVTDNHVDTSYNIYPVTSQDCWGPNVINTHGTHVAFIRQAGANGVTDQRICVMRLTNPSKIVELVSFGKDTSGEGANQLAWPQGDWIYFTTAKMCKYLYRVSTQTREIEFVAHINLDPNGNFGRELKMSAINNRISLAGGLYLTLQEAQTAPRGGISTGPWPGGTFTLQGCGHTISPSGNVMSNQMDPGHCLRIVTQLNWQSRTIAGSAFYWAKARNNMSVDKTDPVLACSLSFDPTTGSDTGFVESIGIGSSTYGNAFSVNSDKWELLVSGWAPDGREQGNGGNAVLWNYHDSIAMNLTRLPRRNNGASDKKVEPQCHIDPNWYFAFSPSFFVTAPVEDILPELRTDATTDYKVPGLDDNTQFPALTMMPKTPDGGLPIVPVGASGPAHRLAHSVSAGRISVTGSARGLRIDFSAPSVTRAVTVFDARGSFVAQRCGTARMEDFTSRDGIRPGLYVIQVRANGRTSTTSVTVM